MPILRAPSISAKMRKLTHRSLRAHEAHSPEVHSHARPASAGHSAGSPGAHGAHVPPVAAHLAPTRLTHPSHASHAAPAPTSAPTPAAVPVAPAAVVVPVAPVAPVPAQPSMDSLIEQARQTVLAQIKTEADSVRELARQRGLQEGRQAGMEDAKKEFAAELARIRTLTASLQQALEKQVQGAEDVMVNIAFAAVCKMLGDTAFSPDGIKHWVQQAQASVLRHEKVVVRLHPADLAALQSTAILDGAAAEAVSWVADKSLQMGGCVLETERGGLDARLETQVQGLRAALLAARE